MPDKTIADESYDAHPTVDGANELVINEPLDDVTEEVTVIFQNIQELCHEKDITITALEVMAGVPNKTVPNWKKSRRWMKHLPAIAQGLGVSIDQLFHHDFEKLKAKKVVTPLMKIMYALEPLSFDDDTADLIVGIATMIIDSRRKDI